jgi:hypothetical protein
MATALSAAEAAVQTALESAEKAVVKAELAADKRFEAVNEFRQTLSDQTATFIPRIEAERIIDSLNSKLDAEMQRTGERFKSIEDSVTTHHGKAAGLTAGWGYLVGAIVVGSILVGALVAFLR